MPGVKGKGGQPGRSGRRPGGIGKHGPLPKRYPAFHDGLGVEFSEPTTRHVLEGENGDRFPILTTVKRQGQPERHRKGCSPRPWHRNGQRKTIMTTKAVVVAGRVNNERGYKVKLVDGDELGATVYAHSYWDNDRAQEAARMAVHQWIQQSGYKEVSEEWYMRNSK